VKGSRVARGHFKRIEKLVRPYRVTAGRKFRLADVNPRDTRGLRSEFKGRARALLARGVESLAEQQEKLYAQDRWGVLLIFQAMDAAGKDSTIKHVMSGVNPQGVEVYSFKAPSSEELDHDYLWRCVRNLPERGRIGIFNRSYYEEVLIVRVHRELLAKQKLPPHLVTERIWKDRYEDIAALERYLARNGYLILKFFLHVSRKEQKRRFLDRIELPEKNWKFSAQDALERRRWNEYMEAYEDMIRHTASPHAPWFVVPADNKWFTRLIVAAAIVQALEGLDLRFPEVDEERRRELARARRMLERE
jgi:PPK2 family polyphosphate:nucleotide phosphotransferase